MKRTVLLAVALVLSFLAGGWLLSGVTTRAADDEIKPKLRGTLYKQWKELGLTDEQKQQVYKIQADYKVKIEELGRRIAALKKEERAKAEAVLTPAQKARLKELLSGIKDTPPAKEKAPPKDKSDEKDK